MKKNMPNTRLDITRSLISFCSFAPLIGDCPLFQSHPDAMLFLDKQNRILAINRRFSTLFDYQLEELKGKKIDFLITFSEQQKFESGWFKKVCPEFYIPEAILTKKDYSTMEIEISASPIFFSNNSYQGALLAIKDITQRSENERINRVLYNISKAANSNISLQELYDLIYQELNNIIFAVNFHIALWDKENDKVIFTYFVDEKDTLDEEVNIKGVSGTLANYNIKYGQSLLVDYSQIKKFAEAGLIKIDKVGTLTKETTWLGVPLKIGNHIIGSMAVVNYDKNNIYSQKDISLMEFVSEQIATAIERKRSEEEIRQNEEKFISLFRSNPLAALYQDKEGNIKDINPQFSALFGYTREDILGKHIDEINFYPPEKIEEGKKLTKKASCSPLIKYETYRRSKEGKDIPVQISTSQVKISGQVQGVIALYENISEQKKNESLKQVLYNISQAANSQITLAQLYITIHSELKKVINADNFYIALLDEQKEKLNFVYFHDEKEESGFSPEKIKNKKTLTDYLIKHQQSLLLNYQQIQELVLEGQVQDAGVVTREISWLSVPLKIEGKVIGAMTVQNYYNPVCYSEKDIELMEIVADQVATAIVRKKSEERITYISFHDTLTGLYNRAYFEEELKRMNHPRFYPLSIVMIDINGLKAVNDAFGHQQGDELLKNLASLLKRNSREVDVLARLGGDEFAIILPNTSKSDVEAFCQRLNRDCQRNSFQPAYLNPNISLGFATQEGTLVNCEEIIKEADNKMYENKLFNAKSREKHLLNAFLTILVKRDVPTESHLQSVAKISSLIGQKMGLKHYDLNRLHLLALLHDIGKIGIPERILFKTEPLTDEEWQTLKNHCQIGYRITKNIPNFSSIAKEVLYHHERWDGTGYPTGLKELEIPLLSRIIAIADAYDVMQSNRNYKKSINQEEAWEEIRKNAGSQFDPELVKVFLEVIRNQNVK